MTSTTATTTAVHMGEDMEEVTAIWDGAIEDTIYAIGEGYLDKHLAALVRACIDRRRHLAEHGLAPALNVPAAPTGRRRRTA